MTKKNRANVLCVLLFLYALPLSAAEQVVLYLKNGDRITGTILSQTTSQITLTNAYVGKVVLQIVEVTKQERVIPPTPEVAGIPAKSTPAAKPATPPVVKVVQVAPVTTNQVSWWKTHLTNWHGNLQVGADLGYGTKEREFFSTQFLAAYNKNRFHDTVNYSLAYGNTDHTLAANRMEGSMKIDYDLIKGRKLYLYDLGVAGYDEIQKVDLRFQEGGGLGYMVLNRPKFLSKADALVINVESGALYQENRYSTGVKKDSFSVRFGQDAIWKVTPKLVVTEKAQFIPDIDDFSDYRSRVDLSLVYPLTTVLTLNLNLVDEYQAKPPPRIKSNDLQIRSTLGFRF